MFSISKVASFSPADASFFITRSLSFIHPICESNWKIIPAPVLIVGSIEPKSISKQTGVIGVSLQLSYCFSSYNWLLLCLLIAVILWVHLLLNLGSVIKVCSKVFFRFLTTESGYFFWNLILSKPLEYQEAKNMA